MFKPLTYGGFIGLMLMTSLISCAGVDQQAMTGSVAVPAKLYQSLVGQSSPQQRASLYSALGNYTMADVDGLLKLMASDVRSGVHSTWTGRSLSGSSPAGERLVSIWQQTGLTPALTTYKQMTAALEKLDKPSLSSATQLQTARVTVDAGVAGMLVAMYTEIDTLMTQLRPSHVQLTDSAPEGFALAPYRVAGSDCLHDDIKTWMDNYVDRRAKEPNARFSVVFTPSGGTPEEMTNGPFSHRIILDPKGKKDALIKDVKVKVDSPRWIEKAKSPHKECEEAITQYYMEAQYKQKNMPEDVIRFAQDQLSRPNPSKFSCFGAGCVVQ